MSMTSANKGGSRMFISRVKRMLLFFCVMALAIPAFAAPVAANETEVAQPGSSATAEAPTVLGTVYGPGNQPRPVTSSVYGYVPGAVFAKESFTADPGPLRGTTGGYGWTEPWVIQTGNVDSLGHNIANESPLVYPGISTEGNYAVGGYEYYVAHRSLKLSSSAAAPYLTGTGAIGKHGTAVWFSALVRKDKDNHNPLTFGSQWSANRLQFGYNGANSNSGGKRYWSITLNGVTHRSNVPVVVGQTTLLVGKVEFGPTNTVSMYVNPDLSQGLPAEPSVTATTDADLSFKNLMYAGSKYVNQMSIDEIRLGTTFHAVTVDDIDFIPPTPPATINVVEEKGESVTLEWSGATDNTGVKGYNIYSLGTLMATTEDMSAEIVGLKPLTSYMFTIRAYDYQGNESADSAFCPARTGEIEDYNRYNFENGQLHGFKTLDTIGSVELDQTFSYLGDASLKINADNGTTKVAVDNPDPNFKNGTKVTFRVFLPQDTLVTGLQPRVYGKTGNTWVMNGSFIDINQLQRGEWNTIEVDFTKGDSPSPQIAMFVFAPGPTQLWMDSITYSGYSDPDVVPPTAPGNLTVTSHTDRMAALSWAASTDDISVSTYEIDVNGALHSIVSALQSSYILMDLEPSTSYTFTVRAKDGAGNYSENSNPVTLVMDAPYVRLSGTNFGSQAQGYTGIDAGENSFKRLTKLRFYVNSPQAVAGGRFQASQEQDSGYTTVYTVRATVQQGWNEIRIDDISGYRYFRFLAAAPNAGAFVSDIEYYGADGDIEPPAAPAGLQVAGLSDTTAELSWTAAIDNFGIRGYLIFVNNHQVGETADTSYTVSGLNPDEAYVVAVQAKDLAGLLSERSQPVTVTTNKATLTLIAVYYPEQERLMVKGTVSSGAGQQVSVAVTDAQGELLFAGQTRSSYDRSYLLSVPVGIPDQESVNVSVNSLGANGVTVQVQAGGGGAAPGLPQLSHNNGYDTGLLDGEYEVHMNLWWGNNATAYKLYENGVLVDSQPLTGKTPDPQSAVTAITGKKNGVYHYVAELSNVHGTTRSEGIIVNVQHAAPSKPALAADNWDGDGTFMLTMNLWWGTNGTSYRLYENGELIDTQTLNARTPQAQTAVTAISGKPQGVYEYRCELTNAVGSVMSDSIIVRVKQ